jgi:hypothetical protein
MKKVIEKYYPQYKVETALAPRHFRVGEVSESQYLEIVVNLKKNAMKPCKH